MELTLNVLWLLLAVASFALVRRGGGSRKPVGWHSWRRTLSLTCALVIFFPVISLTDDLHAAQVVMEDSNPSKRVAKSSGVPGASSSLDRFSSHFMVFAAGALPDHSLQQFGQLAIEEMQFLGALPAGRPRPRAPPSHV